MKDSEPELPREIGAQVGLFDRFASAAAKSAGSATFFAACVALVVLWAPSYPLFQDAETHQLVINTATTIVTFLLVALLQNTEGRADQATQHKLNAIAYALADLMHEHELDDDAAELEAAVGLEKRETSR
jgi:low affinity Fe/Cu permease